MLNLEIYSLSFADIIYDRTIEKCPQNYNTLQELPTSTPLIDNDKCDDRHVKFDLTTGPELSPELQPRQISTRAESSTISMQSTNVCQ